MKRKPKVGVDFDDVLVDFIGSFINWHNEEYGTRAKITDQHTYQFSSSLGLNEEESAVRVRRFVDADIYPRLPALAGAKELLQGLKPYAEVIVVTARKETVAIQTKRNLDLHFSGLVSRIIHAPRIEGPNPDIAKAHACAKEGIALLIDDNHDNISHCVSYVPHIPGIVYTRPWNDKVRCDKTYRAHTHAEILEHALKILGVKQKKSTVPSLVLASSS